jgi:CheY-like chemotaxis protein
LPIVIVDDYTPDLLLAEVAIHRARIKNPVHLMTSGKECIDYFKGTWTSADGFTPQPCLLVLDIVMPIITGLDVLRAIRDLPLAAKSYIVVASGVLDTKKVVAAERLGATTFVIKPLAAEDVANVLEIARDRFVIERDASGVTLRWADSPINKPLTAPAIESNAPMPAPSRISKWLASNWAALRS